MLNYETLKKRLKMNQEQALKFFKGTELEFTEYYKYQFIYTGEKEGKVIIVSFGGDQNSIYKSHFTPKIKFDVDEEFEYMYNKEIDGKDTYTFSDY